MNKVIDAKKKLQEEAMKLFARNGYSCVSVKDIARAANLSTGMVNYHFKSKEALLTDILGEFYLTFHTCVHQLDRIENNSKLKLEVMMSFLVDQALVHRTAMYLYFQEETLKSSRTVQSKGSITAFNDYLQNMFISIVDEGVSTGEFSLVPHSEYVFYTLIGTIREVLLRNQDLFLKSDVDNKIPMLKKSLHDYLNFIIQTSIIHR